MGDGERKGGKRTDKDERSEGSVESDRNDLRRGVLALRAKSGTVPKPYLVRFVASVIYFGAKKRFEGY